MPTMVTFFEGHIDAGFGTTPLAMCKATRLMQRGLVNSKKIISHRFPLSTYPLMRWQLRT
ncbi:MAG: hypothetical protein ACUVSB_04020 [Anaerolineae bacterium]